MFKPVKLLGEVMTLAYLVNANTDYCVFVRYSGHVEDLSLDICKGKDKEGSLIKIHDFDFYIDGKHGHNSEKMLLETKSILEGYLFPNTDELEVIPAFD